MKDISKRIKELRQQQGMTQEELAERVHVTRQAVSNWENKKTRPDVEMLEAISNVFQIELMELLYGPSDRKVTKKQLAEIGLFAGGTVICLLMWVFALPAAEKAARQTYNMSLLLLVHMLVRVMSVSFLPLLFSLVSLQTDIVIREPKVRSICLVAGVVAAVLFVLYWLMFWVSVLLGGTPQVLRNIYAIFAQVGMSGNVMVLVGGLLYLGIKKVQQKEK